ARQERRGEHLRRGSGQEGKGVRRTRVHRARAADHPAQPHARASRPVDRIRAHEWRCAALVGGGAGGAEEVGEISLSHWEGAGVRARLSPGLKYSALISALTLSLSRGEREKESLNFPHAFYV